MDILGARFHQARCPRRCINPGSARLPISVLTLFNMFQGIPSYQVPIEHQGGEWQM